MKVAIDVSPLSGGRSLSHRARGTGFYIENLKRSLLRYYPQYEYTFFTQEEIPSNVAVIHVPYFEPFFLTLPFRNLRKTVVTVHDLIPFVFPTHFPSGLRGAVKWEVQKRLLGRAAAIITDSESSKRDIVKYANIPEEKVEVVYLAASEVFKKVDNTSIPGSIRKKYKLPEKYVLYVGDVTWNKNLPRLIEAIKRINVPLVMVGKALLEKNFDIHNPWNQDLVKVHNLSEGNKFIKRLGFVATEDLVAIYNLATVFAMPSLYEGFGLPILEAMSCGCPVVTTKEGSLGEVGGDAVYYVDPQSIESIANGIGEVFSRKELQRTFSRKGLERAKQFSWKKTAEETVIAYQRIAQGREIL